MQQDKILWLVKGVGGLLCVGLGLSVFGEALSRKISGNGWFWIGTASLVIFNFGLCLMFDSHNHQTRLAKLKEKENLSN